MASGEAVPGKRSYSFLLLALLVEVPLVWMRAHADLRHHIVETITVLLVTSLVYIFSVWLLLRKDSRAETTISIIWILSAALLFRVTVFPLYPAFTDDLYRYRWEGKMQNFGFNPYTTAPDDPRLRPIRDSAYPSIVGKEFRGIYGPVLELIELGFYPVVTWFTPSPGQQIFWFKSIAALADLGIVIVLCLLLRARGMPVGRVLIYAWCPLPVFEFWASGHNDAVVLLFIMGALLLAARKRDSWAAVALSLAVMSKYWPALLFPQFTRFEWRRILPAGVILALVAAVFSAPYWADVTTNAQFTSGFLGGWRNNDSVHGLIAAVAGDPYRAKYITVGLIVAVAVGVAAWASFGMKWEGNRRSAAGSGAAGNRCRQEWRHGTHECVRHVGLSAPGGWEGQVGHDEVSGSGDFGGRVGHGEVSAPRGLEERVGHDDVSAPGGLVGQVGHGEVSGSGGLEGQVGHGGLSGSGGLADRVGYGDSYRAGGLEARVLAVIVAILALSANVHPWYITWIVPLLAFYPIPGLLLWTALAPLGYRVLIDWTILGVWNGNTPFRWLVYVPVAAVLLADWVRASRSPSHRQS